MNLPAYLEGFRCLKDKSLKVTFETQELSPDELSKVVQMLNQFGYLSFFPKPMTEAELKAMEDIQPELTETGKSDSQRLRAVLYRLWERNPEGFDTFTRYYQHRMELIIKHYKSQL